MNFPQRDICFICDEPIGFLEDKRSPSRKPPFAHLHCYDWYCAEKPELRVFLYWWELESMPEYSTTLPTGTTIGKVWRADKNAVHSVARQMAGAVYGSRPPANWRMRMFIPDAHPEMRMAVSFKVTLRHGPMPRAYSAPDWTYMEGWRRERAAERNFEKGLM
jgi:hypothetical protein